MKDKIDQSWPTLWAKTDNPLTSLDSLRIQTSRVNLDYLFLYLYLIQSSRHYSYGQTVSLLITLWDNLKLQDLQDCVSVPNAAELHKIKNYLTIC